MISTGSRRHTLWPRCAATLLAVVLLTPTALGWQQAAAAAAPASALSAVERAAEASVKAETIREVVTALAADEMQGRGTMQPGGDRAATYIADRFAKIGLKPLGSSKNSYLQPIKFRELEFLPETSFRLGDEALKLGRDFVVSQPITGDENVKGELVFIAYGLVSSMLGRNDLAGVDLRDKIVVLLQGPPKNVSKEAWQKAKAQMNIVRSLILQQGVAGLVFLGTGTEEHPYAEMADYMTRRQLEPAGEEEAPAFLPPFLMASDEAAEKMFAASGTTFAQARAQAEANTFKPFALKQTAKITVRLKKNKGEGSNVVGLLEGSDPKLKDEAVVYSAHYDAFGVGAGGRIYHGAADNALGVGELIAAAEALAGARPRRSIIFLAVTGEEYGLFGSEHWVRNPTWKLKQVAADLNFDGVGTEVYGPVKTLVGYGAEHSSLGPLLDEVARASGLKVVPDPIPDEKSFYRSDHYGFVKKGVPALMLLGAPAGDTAAWVARMKNWEKTDYHQPTDVVRADWDWSGARTVAVVGVLLGLRIANAEQMPAWLPGSVFNRERGTNESPPPEP